VPTGIEAVFRGGHNTAAPFALDLNSLTVRHAGSGKKLVTDRDFVADDTFGSLCLPEGAGGEPLEVELSYEYSLLRLDSIVENAQSELQYVHGVSHLSAPHPAPTPSGARLLAHVLVPYFDDGSRAEIWEVTADVAQNDIAERLDTDDLPGAQHTLAATKRLSVLFLGDSITAGAESTSDYTHYTEVTMRGLRTAIPEVTFTHTVAAVGGSRLDQWLGDDMTWDWELVRKSGANIRWWNSSMTPDWSQASGRQTTTSSGDVF